MAQKTAYYCPGSSTFVQMTYSLLQDRPLSPLRTVHIRPDSCICIINKKSRYVPPNPKTVQKNTTNIFIIKFFFAVKPKLNCNYLSVSCNFYIPGIDGAR